MEITFLNEKRNIYEVVIAIIVDHYYYQTGLWNHSSSESGVSSFLLSSVLSSLVRSGQRERVGCEIEVQFCSLSLPPPPPSFFRPLSLCLVQSSLSERCGRQEPCSSSIRIEERGVSVLIPHLLTSDIHHHHPFSVCLPKP